MRAITNAGGMPSSRVRSDCLVGATAAGRVDTRSPRVVQRATARNRGTNIVMAPTLWAPAVIQVIGVFDDVRYCHCLERPFLVGGSAADVSGVGRPVAGCPQPVGLCGWLWPCAAPQLAPPPPSQNPRWTSGLARAACPPAKGER